MFGKPTDAYSRGPIRKLPSLIQGGLLLLASYLTQGNQKSYGFPKPDPKKNKFIASSELLSRYSTGKIEILSEIDSLQGNKILFTNGASKNIDTIVYSTGYTDVFPFFGKDIIPNPHEKIFLDLYKNTIHMDHPNMFFVGLIRPPAGSLIPIAETQAEWVAKIITGKVKSPSIKMMRKENEKDVKQKKKIFKRHYDKNIDYVDYYDFPKELIKEMKKFSIN